LTDGTTGGNSPGSTERPFTRASIAAALGLGVLFAGVLWLMGRQGLSDSGIGLWTGAWTPNTSQWIADPYTTSHVLHGIFFYWLLLTVRSMLPLAWRMIAAVVAEMGWELLENSPTVIDRYRTATASLDYYGDSILNSSVDVLAAMLGFWLAWKLGWKWMLGLIVAIELLMLYFVRDNLTLNVLMLIVPSDAIRAWQMGAVGGG
jgi:hypothetical protein